MIYLLLCNTNLILKKLQQIHLYKTICISDVVFIDFMDFQLTFLNHRAFHLALISAAKTKLESPTLQ